MLRRERDDGVGADRLRAIHAAVLAAASGELSRVPRRVAAACRETCPSAQTLFGINLIDPRNGKMVTGIPIGLVFVAGTGPTLLSAWVNLTENRYRRFDSKEYRIGWAVSQCVTGYPLP
jgi:hypothetical protein